MQTLVTLVENQIADIRKICKKRSVKSLYLFGSALTDQFNSESDLDFLVEFQDLDPEDYADNYFELCYDLESVLKRKVDLVTVNSISNPYFIAEISKKRVKLYPD